ncbi:MAG: sensor histidine kinase [Candidatus Eisenbacteria bacterium]|uniref:histidine kinase n=1 Tax=Eiseniibacteriota bacterium TaxID=2212470 RepID=A0A849SJB5_UNCEI|nr:sensor histidine kinase [Candidatus Eisenbacteria bacterium]
MNVHPTPDPIREMGRLRVALWVVGGALLFGLLESWQGRFVYSDVPAHQFWPEALARSLPSWIALVLLCPPILFLARRVRLDRERWPVALAIHGLAGVVFVFLHLGASSAFISWYRGGDPSFVVATQIMLARWAVADVFTYWALVGMVQVMHIQAERRAREVSEAALRASLSEARLAALRAQLEPHFLFNTLNSISTLALTGEREAVHRAVSALAELLRAMLREHADTFTTLGAELALIDRYLELQGMRYGSRFTVTRDIATDTLEVSVPSLALQPLVENAVEHGIGARRGDGRVSISTRRDGEQLRIEVRDSGPGFPAEVLRGERAGIGLANTRTRLQQLYGTVFRMECSNPVEGGALLTLDLPWRVHPTRGLATIAEARP